MSVTAPQQPAVGVDDLDFELIAESIPHIVWVAAPDGSTEYVNRRGTDYAGRPAAADHRGDWTHFVHPDDVSPARRAWLRATQTEEPFTLEYRIRRADGEFRWHTFRALPMRDANGAVMKWVATATDIDAEHRSREELDVAHRATAEALTMLDTLQASAPVGLGFVDRDFRIVRLNDELAAVSGAPAADQVGRTVAEVLPAIWSQLEPIYERVLTTGEAQVNLDVSGPTTQDPGRLHSWLTSYYPVRLANEIIGIGIVILDITKRKQAEAFRAAVIDNMAEGLYALDAEGRVTFVNDLGAEMLGWTDVELRGKSMHSVIHYQGADGSPHPESECELGKVRLQGRTIHVAEDAFTRKDGTILPVAYSAAPLFNGSTIDGVVVVFRDTTEDRTDRDRVHRELDSLTWIGRIREALDEDRLVLYSQPIVPLRGGPPSQELLVRMIGRDGEVILPGSFVPIAEKYGMIGEIDRWALREAIRLAARGQGVEVNVSAQSIDPQYLLPIIERELRDTGADPANLVFEVTETALMQNLHAGEGFAQGLADIGCGLSLDDFGTGFASFTYLKRLPLRSLKIDIEFVRDLVTNTANQHIVKAVVELARGFGYDTIAEGVEDEETLALLRDYGVDYGQGFLLGAPAPLRTP